MAWKFIATEFLESEGEMGERRIWEAVIRAYQNTGEGVAILNYRTFSPNQQIRWEPDILLVSRDLGLAVIEVKAFGIEAIADIQATQWSMIPSFHNRYLYPFRQGERQLRNILKQCDRQLQLSKRVPGRVIVALPLITKEEWQNRGFEDDHHTCPPLIFGDELNRRNLRNSIEHCATILERGTSPLNLDDKQWNLLQKVILGPKPVPLQPITAPTPLPSQARSRANVLTQLRRWVSDIDWQQAEIGLQIPPGPQRIRGIAGSGKTLLLCQKAAQMHLQHPEWDIAIVFFTRSLYPLISELVQSWIQYWSDASYSFDPLNSKLKIVPAWGTRNQPGFYSLLRDQCGLSAAVSEKISGSPPELLATACKRLLSEREVQPIFDAILIDEGQDLAASDELKYEDKQAIYWLAWQALRPITSDQPQLRRLIWAYDEAQNLDSLKIPSYGEVFGEKLGRLLSGHGSGPTYRGGVLKSQVMKRCYRTPGPILTTAHGIGMGLLRKEGMLSGFTTQSDWDKVGYQVQAGSFTSQQRITLHRPPEHSPNPLPQLWGSNPLTFKIYDDRNTQLEALVRMVQHNLTEEGLQPSRDLLVVVLGTTQEDEGRTQLDALTKESLQLQTQVAHALKSGGLNYYLPGARTQNQHLDAHSRDANKFWHEGAVTVSRIHRAKGHEAPMVYVVGLELVAKDESSLTLRNQLFVALTRSMAWVHLSGIKEPQTVTNYLLYDEMRQVINSNNTFRFTYRRTPNRTTNDAD